MKNLNEGLIHFFQKQHYVIVTTIDEEGCPHNSCKGIVEIYKDSKVYLLDLYRGKTYLNLQKNHKISITAVDGHKFIGYSLKGRAKIVEKTMLEPRILKLWEEKITKRLSHRLIKNIKGEKGHPRHPEVLLPKPEYLIEVDVKKVVNLTPRHIREGI